jgi:Ser-tRNA(Ala) deacylase AlaX
MTLEELDEIGRSAVAAAEVGDTVSIQVVGARGPYKVLGIVHERRMRLDRPKTLASLAVRVLAQTWSFDTNGCEISDPTTRIVAHTPKPQKNGAPCGRGGDDR